MQWRYLGGGLLGRRERDDMLGPPRFLAVKLSPGDLIDQKYRILRMLGTGGMGSVYEAENIRVERRVAIKVMHRVRDQQDIQRFEREARAAQIGSPNIVQVFDLGYLADGEPYMVMEYLAGETLGERLQRVQHWSPVELLPVANQILDGLVAAHRAGIIHRDLKPDNVFLARLEGSPEEVVKLLDFGISKFTDAAKKPAEVSLTRSGVAVGTPHYMSPEQVQGSKGLDTRTDLYSLGVILYRCLSGHLPFQSDDVAPLLVQILLETAKPLHEFLPQVDPVLSGIIARAMARRAEDRFQTAAEFREALVVWEKSRRGAARPGLPPPTSETFVQSQLPKVGTNAPWSSTASPIPESKRAIRHILLAAAFSISGFVGLFVAYELWTAGRPASASVAGAVSALPSPSAATVAPMRTRTPVAAPPAEVMPLPAATSAQVNPVQPAAARPVPRQASPAAHPPAALPSPAPPPPAVASVVPPAVVSPAVAPAKAPPDSDSDYDNRHMSRGFH